jgi:hypothetical protein
MRYLDFRSIRERVLERVRQLKNPSIEDVVLIYGSIVQEHLEASSRQEEIIHAALDRILSIFRRPEAHIPSANWYALHQVDVDAIRKDLELVISD